jgi:lactoylglutathione lyase
VLRDAVSETGVQIATEAQEAPNPASPWPPPFLGAIRTAAEAVWPKMPVVGMMETGFTDGNRFRRAGIPAYGISALFLDVDDIRAHGRDERVPVEAFYQGLDYNYNLLKAVAMLPAPAPRPKILGLAGMGITVSDLERSRAFYRDFLGLAETPRNPSRMRIGESQYVELIPGAVGKDGRLDHVAFYTTDAAAMRRYLASHGMEGEVRDADGHAIRFLEPAQGSAAAAEGAVSDHMQHAGFTVWAYEPAMQFYRDLLGFRTTWKGSTGPSVLIYVNMQVPDGSDFVEYILYAAMPAADRRGSANHICLLVPDMAKAVAALEARRTRVGYTRPIEIAVGRNHRRQANLYDPDGTRTEIMEPNTIDGRPSPWSDAPPPR